MEAAEDKNTREILQTVLSMQKIEDVQVNEVNSWQENEEDLQTQEQVIWQIETSDTNRPTVLETSTSSILHHLPVTYLTTDNQNLIFSKPRKPLTYILNPNLDDAQKLQKINKEIFLQDPQKVVVVQSLDTKFGNSETYSNMGQMTMNYSEAKVYKVNDCGRGSMYFSTQNVESDKDEFERQIAGDASVTELKEISNSEEVEDLDRKISGGKSEEEFLSSGTKQRKRKKDEGSNEDDDSIDIAKNLEPLEKVKKVTKNKIERKILSRKKKLKKRNVNIRNKLKSSKKIDRLGEAVMKGSTVDELSDEKKQKDRTKEKRNLDELTKLEERAEQVAERFKIGCECVDYNCFEGLNPEKVFRHRLNIADLTKAEHDMYLMGVIMTSMQNPEETCRHKERLRIRSTYVYQGKRVCLTAFLYLEHVTLYQMKRLRKHLKYHGVSPRIHGNRDETADNIVVRDVAELLHTQYAIITGGKTENGCPIITFPDVGNFSTLSDLEYQRLILYLTSVPSMQEADVGFVLVIDRRNDKWNSVKPTLLKLSGFFPGLVHTAYVLRPSGIIKKTISDVLNKLFKEDFKFKVIICNSLEELHSFIDKSQLTPDLGGYIQYNHVEWIQQREQLEKFSAITKDVSVKLHDFTRSLQETPVPKEAEAIQELLSLQQTEYSELKEEILNAAKHGETLLEVFRSLQACLEHANRIDSHVDKLGNVAAVERLLVQLEETERTFCEFQAEHFQKLKQLLDQRIFEKDVAELEIKFEHHLKTVGDMVEIGENVGRVDTLIKEANAFQKLCLIDIDRAEEVISNGQRLLKSRQYTSLDFIQSDCDKLKRLCIILSDRIDHRLDALKKHRELQEQIDKANSWCAKGVELLSAQHIEKASGDSELLEKSILEINAFLAAAEELQLNNPKDLFKDNITPETKALVTQVIQRIADVSSMCDKRLSSLQSLVKKRQRPVQTVTPEPGVPLQPSHGAPILQKPKILIKAKTVAKLEDPWNQCKSVQSIDEEIPSQDPEVLKSKRQFILAELLETEQVYVNELHSILKGYKAEMDSPEMKSLIPIELIGKSDVLFGNLDEIHAFHSGTFLRDLENCISTTELVALCFTHRKNEFYKLYSTYCQNSPKSEQLRELVGERNFFFGACQIKLGHKLPLAAYLLKPIQRITKYQLLLKDLLRYSEVPKCRSQLQEALNCMLVVLKCVNDSMHQIAITGFRGNLSEQGELLMQGSFSVWTESKKIRELRLTPMQRHIFLYRKAILFCKKENKENSKATYHFKRYLQMSQIGLTESVKGDPKKFEIWLQGRQQVHTIQASTVEQKMAWVQQIKEVLLEQLAELRGANIRQYSLNKTPILHRSLRQTSSWESQSSMEASAGSNNRAFSCDESCTSSINQALLESGEESSDQSNSDDEEGLNGQATGGKYVVLADYRAQGHSEISLREGDLVEILKIGCGGWWYVKVLDHYYQGQLIEGWAPSAYLEPCKKKGFAWVTLATNDSYSLGALVLAHSLRNVKTAHKLAVLITPSVSQSMREQLSTVFDVVKVVNVLDSKDEAHLALMKRPELGITFTKIHCWRLTEFDKCVFLDADTLVIKNCDELFEREELSAAPDVGWPDCFNSGVFVYKPSEETFKNIIQFSLQHGSFDGGDQGLLNQYFSDWATKDIQKHLPFVYNLTSVAVYSYIPAFKQYGSEVRIVHFIGTGKPWLQQLDPSTKTVNPTPGAEHLTSMLQMWWDIFCEKVHPSMAKNLDCGMSYDEIEACSNDVPVERDSAELIEPSTPYLEKDDSRQINLPYHPFNVKSSSGELLNITYCEQRKEMEEEQKEEDHTLARESDCQETPQEEPQIESKDSSDQIVVSPDEEEQVQKEWDHTSGNTEDKTFEYVEEPHAEDSTPTEEPVAEQNASPFSYDTFYPDETCVQNYLDHNITTYQPFDDHYKKLDYEPVREQPLPRFLAIAEDDKRQSLNVCREDPQPQPESRPPQPKPQPVQESQQPSSVQSPDFIDRVCHPTDMKVEINLSRSMSQENLSNNINTNELQKCKSMSDLEVSETEQKSPDSVEPTEEEEEVSFWHSHPSLNVNPNKKFSMPKLKPLKPKQNINQVTVNDVRPKVTLYTEFHMSSECKDAVPTESLGFVEKHIIQEITQKDMDLETKLRTLSYIFPQQLPDNSSDYNVKPPYDCYDEMPNYDLSTCQRQKGNRPMKNLTKNKENSCFLPVLKPLRPEGGRESEKKSRSNGWSSKDKGTKAKIESRKARENAKTKLNTKPSIQPNNVEEILKRLINFSKDYQKYFSEFPEKEETTPISTPNVFMNTCSSNMKESPRLQYCKQFEEKIESPFYGISSVSQKGFSPIKDSHFRNGLDTSVKEFKLDKLSLLTNNYVTEVTDFPEIPEVIVTGCDEPTPMKELVSENVPVTEKTILNNGNINGDEISTNKANGFGINIANGNAMNTEDRRAVNTERSSIQELIVANGNRELGNSIERNDTKQNKALENLVESAKENGSNNTDDDAVVLVNEKIQAAENEESVLLKSDTAKNKYKDVERKQRKSRNINNLGSSLMKTKETESKEGDVVPRVSDTSKSDHTESAASVPGTSNGMPTYAAVTKTGVKTSGSYPIRSKPPPPKRIKLTNRPKRSSAPKKDKPVKSAPVYSAPVQRSQPVEEKEPVVKPSNIFTLLPEDSKDSPVKTIATNSISKSRPHSRPAKTNHAVRKASEDSHISRNAASTDITPAIDKSGIAGAIAKLSLQPGGLPGTETEAAAESAQDNYIRRQNWEMGTMDYMGRDSFDNIWAKICETIDGKVSSDLSTSSELNKPPMEVTPSSEGKKVAQENNPTEAPLKPEEKHESEIEHKSAPSVADTEKPGSVSPPEKPAEAKVDLPAKAAQALEAFGKLFVSGPVSIKSEVLEEPSKEQPNAPPAETLQSQTQTETTAAEDRKKSIELSDEEGKQKKGVINKILELVGVNKPEESKSVFYDTEEAQAQEEKKKNNASQSVFYDVEIGQPAEKKLASDPTGTKVEETKLDVQPQAQTDSSQPKKRSPSPLSLGAAPSTDVVCPTPPQTPQTGEVLVKNEKLLNVDDTIKATPPVTDKTFENPAEKLSKAAEDVKSQVENLIDQAKESVISRVENIVDQAKESVKDVKSQVENLIDQAKESVKEQLGSKDDVAKTQTKPDQSMALVPRVNDALEVFGKLFVSGPVCIKSEIPEEAPKPQDSKSEETQKPESQSAPEVPAPVTAESAPQAESTKEPVKATETTSEKTEKAMEAGKPAETTASDAPKPDVAKVPEAAPLETSKTTEPVTQGSPQDCPKLADKEITQPSLGEKKPDEESSKVEAEPKKDESAAESLLSKASEALEVFGKVFVSGPVVLKSEVPVAAEEQKLVSENQMSEPSTQAESGDKQSTAIEANKTDIDPAVVAEDKKLDQGPVAEEKTNVAASAVTDEKKTEQPPAVVETEKAQLASSGGQSEEKKTESALVEEKKTESVPVEEKKTESVSPASTVVIEDKTSEPVPVLASETKVSTSENSDAVKAENVPAKPAETVKTPEAMEVFGKVFVSGPVTLKSEVSEEKAAVPQSRDEAEGPEAVHRVFQSKPEEPIYCNIDDVEEIKVTSEEDRKKDKPMSSKLTEQILKAIPAPERKPFSDATAAGAEASPLLASTIPQNVSILTDKPITEDGASADVQGSSPAVVPPVPPRRNRSKGRDVPQPPPKKKGKNGQS